MAIILLESDRLLGVRHSSPAERSAGGGGGGGWPALTNGLAAGGTPVSVRPLIRRSASFGGPTRSVGSLSAPSGTGRTRCGVTMITSSRVLMLEAGRTEQSPDDRDGAEQRDLADGVLEILADEAGHGEALAVADLKRRLRTPGLEPGIVKLFTMIDAVGSMELTSGASTRLITPSASTVGVKARLTPKGLNWTVIAEVPPPVTAIAL